ncbi:hypothetical protein MKX08_007732 [Trichoderma sp. CBMAI-0020]|nr:hypothetical protein MKX08_007732 [Trichoderma sp. CBMAI-0020]
MDLVRSLHNKESEVEYLKYGILFIKAAKLAKVQNLTIPFMAERLKNNPVKKAILDILFK